MLDTVKTESVTIPPDKTLEQYINQNGVKPGPKKLAQFRLALKIRGTPDLGAQEGKGLDGTMVYVKLFDPTGSFTWFITEYNPYTNEAYGYIKSEFPEHGYVSLQELAYTKGRLGIGIEIDTNFKPTTLRLVDGRI